MSWFQYKCLECGCEFDEPRTHFEDHGFTYGPREIWKECPYCGSGNYQLNQVTVEVEGETSCTL